MISSRFFIHRSFVFSLLLLFMITVGCSKKKQIKGHDVVPEDTMVEMMVEMHLIDGITNDVTYYRKYNPNDSIDLYGYVFNKYGVSKEEFHKTLQEYANVPRLLDKLYGEVMKELNLMQQELDRERDLKIEEKEMKKKDAGKELPQKFEGKSKKRSADLRPEK